MRYHELSRVSISARVLIWFYSTRSSGANYAIPQQRRATVIPRDRCSRCCNYQCLRPFRLPISKRLQIPRGCGTLCAGVKRFVGGCGSSVSPSRKTVTAPSIGSILLVLKRYIISHGTRKCVCLCLSVRWCMMITTV